MSIGAQVYLAGAVIFFIVCTYHYSQLNESERWGLAKPWEVYVRSLILAVMWPFAIVTFAVMEVYPPLRDWVYRDDKW